MGLTFEWNPIKAASNWEKHKVSFEEASSIFEDLLSVTILDPDHSDTEDRYLIIGASSRSRLLIVSFIERPHTIRIISARTLTPRERIQYEKV